MTKSNKTKSSGEFQVGDRVFAKLKGYPWWPARIESVEKNAKPVKYKIIFYATYQTNIIKSDSLVLFDEDSIQKYGEPRKYKFFNEAMDEIRNDPNLKNLKPKEEIDDENFDIEGKQDVKSEELDQDIKIDVEKESSEQSLSESDSIFESDNSYNNNEHFKSKNIKKSVQKTSRKKAADSNQTEDRLSEKRLKVEKNNEQPKIRKSLRKKETSRQSEQIDTFSVSSDSQSAKSEDESKNNLKESDLEIRKSSRKRQNIKRVFEDERDEKPKSAKTRKVIGSDEENESALSTEESDEKNDKEIDTKPLIKSPIQNEINEQEKSNPLREEEKETKNNKNNKKVTIKPKNSSEEGSQIMNEQINSEEKKEEKTLALSSVPVQKIKKEAKERWLKMSLEERETEKQKLKEKKIYEKKLSKIKSIKIQFALLRMDIEIKKSLKEDNMDTERCCLLIQDLIKLPFTQKNLFKAPEIVETIRKCRKFKGCEKVKELANECFYKFLYMFPINSGESFWSVFERERLKYMLDNEDELKKERIIANKILQHEDLEKSKKNQSSSKQSPGSENKIESRPLGLAKKPETKMNSDRLNSDS